MIQRMISICLTKEMKNFIQRLGFTRNSGLEHRIGGLEKAVYGNVSYDADNHDYMVKLRQDKIDIIADYILNLKFMAIQKENFILSWGGTYGA